MNMKLSERLKDMKRKATNKLIAIQTDFMCSDSKLKSRAGLRFLTGCLAVSGSLAPALAAGGGGSADDIASKIQDSVGEAYDAMKTVGVVVAAVGVALAAFYLFTGGDKGMEKAKKTILYTVLGCGILFLAVPIVNFCAGLFSGSSDGFDALNTTP